MLAREYCDLKHMKKKRRFKPIILSHHMLMGLKEGQAKMSKSDADTAIFMEDSESDVRRKIKQAFCPPQVVENNPILDYCKHVIFQKMQTFEVQKVNKVYSSYEELENDFKAGLLHPSELKPAVANALNDMIEPVRRHFSQPHLQTLLETVRTFKITK